MLGLEFQLLLADLLNLPLTGMDFLLRTKESFPHLTVVVARAVNDEDLIQSCIRARAYDARVVTKEVAENFGKPLQYQPSTVGVSYDPTTTQLGPAPFIIQRREATPYTDNKYFSVAPVKT